MSSNDTKLSFSFAPPTSSSSKPAPTTNSTNNNNNAGPSSTPKSNFELLLAKSKAPQKPSPSTGTTKKPAFSFDEDDDDDHPSNNALAGPSKTKAKPKAPVGQTNLLSRNERKALEMAESIDQSIFNYDEHYESMKSAERSQEEAKKKESEERKPKYIESFLASAQTRKLDKLRAEEKALQREREKEGDEFEGKEKFVTDNYKRQMEEVRKAEEEERKREEELRKTRSGPGLTAFYKSMLESSEAENAAAVAATSGPSSVAGQGPSLAIRPPSGPANKPEYDDEEEYDPLLAREAKAQAQTGSNSSGNSNTTGGGGNTTNPDVEINDEGEIVDKRSLLKAGLNITKKPKPPALPNSLLTGQRSGEINEGPYKSRAVGTAASYSERMERERRRLADQMREQAERKRREEEERVRAEEEEARRRREGDNGDAERKRQEARERFLARKRQREEDEREKREKKAREE